MKPDRVEGDGSRERPWQLKTPSGSSEYQMYRDKTANPPALVCTVGKTELRYQLRCLDNLHTMLKAHGDWMPLGSADEQKPAAEETVEAWGRSPKWSTIRRITGCGRYRVRVLIIKNRDDSPRTGAIDKKKGDS